MRKPKFTAKSVLLGGSMGGVASLVKRANKKLDPTSALREADFDRKVAVGAILGKAGGALATLPKKKLPSKKNTQSSIPMPKVPTPEGRPRANPLQGSSYQLQGTEPTETFMRTVRPQTLQRASRTGTRKTKPTRLMKYL